MKICPSCMAEFAGGEVFCPVDGTRLTTPSKVPPPGGDPLVGCTLSDRYLIHRPIGEGGMGIVYEAEHVVIEKRVALKVLRDDFSKNEDVVERFRQEAKSASRIGHEHIVDISDFGETPGGQSYFVMEYLEGEDLASLLEREGTVAPDRAVTIALQCCQALGAAHRKGIVHRDMKPENVFLVRREDGQDFVKLVDFGIAKMSDIETAGAPGRKLTKTGMIFGTPEYMSPEQAAGRELDHRVDIYALGIILYEMLSGQVPFMGDTFMSVLSQHMFEEVPPLRHANGTMHASADLEATIRQALAKDPEDRFQTMGELGRALAGAIEWSQDPGTNPGFGDPLASRAASTEVSRNATTQMGPAVESSGPGEPGALPLPYRHRLSRKAVAGVGMIGAVLAVGAVVAWLALRSAPDTLEAEAGSAAVQEVAPSEASSDHEGDSEAAEPPTDEAAHATGAPPEEPSGERADDVGSPATVNVTVTTRPTGARLAVADHGEVCASTPCSFQATPGEPITLEARRGRWTARHRLTPSEPTEEVDLRLTAPQATTAAATDEAKDKPTGGAKDKPTGGAKDEPAAEPGGGERTGDAPAPAGDLKVPDIFR
jgi:eukaryotic-like serine/threonine-protein kinase